MSTTQVCEYQGAEATAQHLRGYCLSQGLVVRCLLLSSPHALTHCIWSSVSAAHSTSCPTELYFMNMLEDVKYFLFALYQAMNIMHIFVCVHKFYFCFLLFIFISFHLFLVNPAILCPHHFFIGLRTSATDIIMTEIAFF